MQLGSYEIPERRLVPNSISDLKLIYENNKTGEIKSSDISTLFGYKHPTATPFYHRLNSLVSFGLLEGRGKFRITSLGKDLLFPENDEHDKVSKTNAIFHVPLWKTLYAKYKKNLPSENLWVQLKNITGVQPDESQKAESEIRKWYNEDIAHVSEEPLGLGSQSKGLSSTTTQSNQMSQQMAQLNDVQVISFDKYQVSLPKGDLTKEWEKLKKYMEVKLEDYEYQEQEAGLEQPESSDEESQED